MSQELPSEDELRRRILHHLERRGPTQTVCGMWQGYLAALVEWGLIDSRRYDTLVALIPDARLTELYELFDDIESTDSPSSQGRRQGAP